MIVVELYPLLWNHAVNVDNTCVNVNVFVVLATFTF